MPRGQGLKMIKIDFTKVKNMTLGELFSTEPIPVSDLNKLLWRLIKKENLRLGKVYPVEKPLFDYQPDAVSESTLIPESKKNG